MSQVLEARAEERPDPDGSARTDQRTPRWWKSVPTFLSVLALFTSGAVFLAVFLTTRSADEARLRLEYIRVAVAILKPAKPTEAQKELREWAVELLDKSAEVKLSAEQKQNLINGTSALPRGTDYYDGGGFDTYTDVESVMPPRPSATAKPKE